MDKVINHLLIQSSRKDIECTHEIEQRNLCIVRKYGFFFEYVTEL